MTVPPSATADAFRWRLALFFGALSAVIGIQMPFFPLWLQAKGLGTEAIGLVLAAPMAVRLISVPITVRLVDRRGSLRGGLIKASFGAALGYAIVGFAEGFGAVLITVMLASIAFGLTVPLADAYALKGLGSRGYGPVRLWGSAAFIAANLGAGVLSLYIPATGYVWVMLGALALMSIASMMLRPVVSPAVRPAGAPSTRSVLLSPLFLAVAVGASLIQASHALYYGFSTVQWAGEGLSGTTIGALWAIGVVSEIALFAFSPRLPPWLGPIPLLALGAAGAMFRWSVMAFDPGGAWLPLLQCLHGLSFGATYLGSMQFLAQVAPDRRLATVQGDFTTILGVAMPLAMALSGRLFAQYGSQAYAAMAVLAGLGAILILVAQRQRQVPAPP